MPPGQVISLFLLPMSPPLTLGWVHNLYVAPAKSDASSIVALAAAFSTIAVLFTILRFGVRWKTVGRFGLDDFAIAASAVSQSSVLGDDRWIKALTKSAASGSWIQRYSHISFVYNNRLRHGENLTDSALNQKQNGD